MSYERGAGRILVDQLLVHAVDTVFCVPGESYLPVLDSLYDVSNRIRQVSCRHEGGAAYMAESYGKLTQRPGICFVSRGPGATNASIGVHTAEQNGTPLILFIGQVPRGQRGRGAFQEVSYTQMFGSMAKEVLVLDDARRVPELVRRAFHVAAAGRPGPVVVEVPTDMLDDAATVPDATPYRAVEPCPDARDVDHALSMVERAERPLLLLGGTPWSAQAATDARRFSEQSDIPVCTAFRCQDYIDNASAAYAGTLGLGVHPWAADLVKQSDVVLVIGARPDAMTSGNSTLFGSQEHQRLIHVYPDPDVVGRDVAADLAICASGPAFLAAITHDRRSLVRASANWRAEARNRFLRGIQPPPSSARLDLGAVVTTAREMLPADAVATNGAGAYTIWCQRYLTFSHFPSQLAPQAGGMGYGLPAALSSKIVFPRRPAVVFAGDGCFLMTGQELATAKHYNLPVVIIIVNDGAYGSIRQHQERRFPDRPIGTALSNPDFQLYGRAFGADGAIVDRTEQFAPALSRALAADAPFLIELHL